MFWNSLFTRESSHARKFAPAAEALEARIAPAALIGLTTTNQLITFDSGDADHILHSAKISGLPKGEDIVSIDSRPANGLLYGLSNKDTLYTLNPISGLATAVGTQGIALVGKYFAMDFNPTVDRLRAVSDAEQNLRVNPITGATIDGDAGTSGTQPDTALAYDAADVNVGKNPMISAIAYDRNFQGTTQTTLFGIDSTLNTLVLIGSVNGTPNSPNGGLLTTVGSLGVDPTKCAGLEIAADGTAYAALQVKGKTALYTINLTTGAATRIEPIGTGALKLDALSSLPREEIVYGVTASGRLVSFHANNPGHLDSAVALRGLIAGEKVTSIDFRPATGELFGLTSSNRIVSINTASGQTTQLGVPLVTSPQFTANSPGGFDFNPTVDRLRLVDAANDNVRFNPLTYAPVDSDGNAANGNTPDTSLAYIATDPNVGMDPNIVGSAYDRNDNDGGIATTLWGIDSTLNNLVRQGAVDGNAADTAGGGSPNGGLLTTIGSLGVDPTDQVGFDIIDQGTQGKGAALAVMQIQGETVSKLFSINLTAGLTNQPAGGATLIGTVGGGEVLTAMAIAPATIQFSAASFVVKEKVGAVAFIDITRTGGSGSIATVRFDTFEGTALAGLDYTDLFGQIVTFGLGETTKRVQVSILLDTLAEQPETVMMSLSSVTGGDTQLGTGINSILLIR
jgi:hypothetical protein